MWSNSVLATRCSFESAPESPGLLLDEHDQWSARVRALAPETVRRRRMYLERFVLQVASSCSEELLQWLSVLHLQSFVVDYARTHGPGSQRWMVDSLRGFLRFCHFRGYLTEALRSAVPSRCRRRLARVPRSLDDESIGRLLVSIDRNCPLGRRDAAIITLAVTYGVRGIQLRRMRLDDIDWETDRIDFPAAKGGKALCLPLTAEAGNAVLDYLKNGRPNGAPYHELFLQARVPFRPFTESSVFSKIVSRRLKRAGIEVPRGVSRGLHSFRHAFASRLVGRVPFKHIADLLGHRNLSSSFIYTKVDFEGLSETALPWPEEVTP